MICCELVVEDALIVANDLAAAYRVAWVIHRWSVFVLFLSAVYGGPRQIMLLSASKLVVLIFFFFGRVNFGIISFEF